MVQLLEARASCEARAVTADTPLHVAVRASALPVVELLLLQPEAGAWLRAKNQTGQLPADCVAAANDALTVPVWQRDRDKPRMPADATRAAAPAAA